MYLEFPGKGRFGNEGKQMLRKLALIASVVTFGLGTPVVAQDISVLLGGRATASDTSAGYLSVTGTFGAQGAGGVVLRGELEDTTTVFAGDETVQDAQRLLLGYSFVTGAGNFTALAGPTRVTRSVNGGPDIISETGLYLGVEGDGFIGDRGYWAGIAQYSSPDEAFFTRAFSTYQVGGNVNIGPDFSYLNEPDFERGTLGVRTAWTFDRNVLALIAGATRETGTLGSDETEGFLELQFGTSF